MDAVNNAAALEETAYLAYQTMQLDPGIQPIQWGEKKDDTVRKCIPGRILFLNASEEPLHRNKQNDSTRSGNFFDSYLQHLLPLKRRG